MEDTPFISFCFTTFKRHDFLKITLEGILRQTFTNFEVVVSDNDPEGSARPVIEAFNDQRFKYFPNGQNLGMKKSFNKSLERSTGNYIVMIADDDPVYPDMLETLIDLTVKHPGYGLYLGGCNWFCMEPDLAAFYQCKVGVNSCLAAKSVGTIDVYTPEAFLHSFFNFKIFPNYLWSTAIVRREVLIEMGGVPDYGTAFLGDYAYMSIMGGQSGCVVINKALGHQTLHKHNFGRNQHEELVILAPNFINYVSSKLSHVKGWPVIKKQMIHFVAVWLVRHIAFLKAYNIHNGDPAANKEIDACAKKIFAIPEMKPYHLKYVLLTRFPKLHDAMVKWKSKFKAH